MRFVTIGPVPAFRGASPWAAPFVAVALSLALGACSGVGDGNAIESIEVLPGDGTVDASDETFHVNECIPQSLAVVGTFSDGSRGTFTGRAAFSSDNPSVADVSDGTVPVEGLEGQVYQRGAVLPAAPGTATITAEFVGLTASLAVTVDPLGEISFTSPNPTVGVDTAYLVNLETILLDNPANVRTAAFWSFVEPDDEIATIDTTTTTTTIAGRVIGIAEGGPLLAKASFPLCGREYTTNVTIEPVDSLTLEREFTGTDAVPATGDLVIETSERFSTYGNFASGAERQDLTSQVSYDSSDDEIAIMGAVGGANYVYGLAQGGPVEITSYFGVNDAETEEDDRLPSNSLPLSVVDAALDSFSISPQELVLPQNCTYQFTATGSFDGGAYVQDITRHVSWTTEDFEIATVDNSFAIRGTFEAVGEIGESIAVTATFVDEGEDEGTEDDIEITDTATLTIGEPGLCPGSEEEPSEDLPEDGEGDATP